MILENVEISDRLEAFAKETVTFSDRLKPALKHACYVLEHLTPAVMGMTGKGFVSTLAAQVQTRTWLTVLANQTKVLVIGTVLPRDMKSAADFMEPCVKASNECFDESIGRQPAPQEILGGIDFAVKKHGVPSKSKQIKDVDPQILMQMIGLLWSPVPPPGRAHMAEFIDVCIKENVCPLHVGLVGKGQKPGTLCGAWPMTMPLAPYLNELGL